MKKKRRFLFLMLALAAVILSSCGGRKVSDTELKWVVEDYFNYGEALADSHYIDYDYKFTHEVDSAANADMVDITLTFRYPYGTRTTTKSQVYQYDRSSKNWLVNRFVEWSVPVSEFDEASLLKAWDQETVWGDVYHVDIQEIDFAAGTVTLSYDVECTVGWDEDYRNYTGEGTYFLEGPYNNDGVYEVEWINEDLNNGKTVNTSLVFDVESGVSIHTFEDRV